ncbi:MAG TPA: hypothetical protein VMD47_09880 [Candidatus Acidoferrales bacterium]|nr:hypothetical protein [Candidatus Acidoferrales bacterium]
MSVVRIGLSVFGVIGIAIVSDALETLETPARVQAARRRTAAT